MHHATSCYSTVPCNVSNGKLVGLRRVHTRPVCNHWRSTRLPDRHTPRATRKWCCPLGVHTMAEYHVATGASPVHNTCHGGASGECPPHSCSMRRCPRGLAPAPPHPLPATLTVSSMLPLEQCAPTACTARGGGTRGLRGCCRGAWTSRPMPGALGSSCVSGLTQESNGIQESNG